MGSKLAVGTALGKLQQRMGDMLWESPLRQARDLPARSYGGPACLAFDSEHAPAWLAAAGLPASLQLSNFLLVNGAMLLVYAATSRWPRRPLPAGWVPPPAPAPTTLDRLVGACLAVPLLAKLCFALLGNKGLTIINPCHILNAVQLWAATRRGQPGVSRAMLLFMPWICGATVAMITPDPETEFVGEGAQFWAEHVMIAIVAPLYFVVRDGSAVANPGGLLGELERDPTAFVRGTLFYYAQSLIFLMPLARLTTINSNYMLCPPGVLEAMGEHYMTFWLAGAFPVALILSWLMVLVGRALLWQCPTRFQPSSGGVATGKKKA